jgi:hypothetical protein
MGASVRSRSAHAYEGYERADPCPIFDGVQRAANSGAGARSAVRSRGALELIRQTHVEHDARIAVSNAIHEAEVVVIGRGDSELGGRIARHLSECGGSLAAAIGPDTRFAVRASRATAADVDAACARGVAVIDEAEFERMVEVHAAHTNNEQVHAAARRAVDANRSASLAVSAGPIAPEPRTHGQRMATSREDAKRRAPKPISEGELELEQHARNVRSLNTSSPFRHQRQPLVQPD